MEMVGMMAACASTPRKQWLVSRSCRCVTSCVISLACVMAELLARGWVAPHAPDNQRTKTTDWYRTTVAGSAFASAMASKAITRPTAVKAVADFLERVAQVETTSDYLYRVKSVVVFGSYLGTGEYLSDVDLAVTLAPKLDDMDELEDLEEKQRREEEERGRKFPNLVERFAWPQTKVWMFLKGKSRVLQFTDPKNEVVTNGAHKTIYAVATMMK
jgi:predicted nucleotidyltransferase